MIELKQVYYKESNSFIETEIHFNYVNSDGIYTILEFKDNNEVTHFISYKYKHFNDSKLKELQLLSPSTLTNKDIDFINAFNQYFNYQIPFKQ